MAFFWASPFFFLQKEDFFSLKGVARQTCRALRSGACKWESLLSQMHAALVSNWCFSTYTFQSFFFIIKQFSNSLIRDD